MNTFLKSWNFFYVYDNMYIFGKVVVNLTVDVTSNSSH